MAPASQRRYHLAVVVLGHRFDLCAQPEGNAAITQLVDEFIDDLDIDEVQEGGTRFHHRYRHVQRAEHGGIFDADHPGANHRQAARQARHVHHLVAVHDVGIAEIDVVRAERHSAHRDQYPPPFDHHHAAVGQGNRQPVCSSMKRATPAMVCTPLRRNWCSSTSTSCSSVLARRILRSSLPISRFTRYDRP